MAVLTPDQIDDLVTLTTDKFYKYKWTDLSLEYQEYVSAAMLDEKHVVETGGPNISFRVQVRNTGNAINTGLYATDKVGVEDLMESATVPWTKQTGSWSYDIDEPLFQGDQETIVKELVVREHSCINDIVELNEENLWSEPSTSADKRPMGIPFWIRKASTWVTTGAFSGGNPTGTGLTGGCGGLSSTTYPRWRNWTFGYAAVTTDDLVASVKKAIWSTRFIAPVPHPELGFGKADWQIYTTYRVQEPAERLAESRNDNLGKDLARYMNQVLIGGIPLKAVPYLEANDTSDPLYGVNWRVMRPYVLKGCNMRRSKPKQAPHQNTVRNVFIDTWMNYICVDRRKTFIGSKS